TSVILVILQIIVAACLIGVILLQMQGSGLGSSFGGGGEFYRSKQSIEKMLVYVTIALTVVFGGLSIVLLLPHP
ncbi:MAG TPA: preprotein translocase subunit SecG, partial [Candidatus Saccharimonadales bacterium]|nr:preprotein translocase subunit SecG [Candidatus Saccharimonadales bacterium]